jgi:streptogramin lyase
VEVDPRTGERTDHKALFGGEYLQVDVDGTVWYGGLIHLDPKTELQDTYRLDGDKPIPVSSMAIDSNGDMWLSELGLGAIAKHDRKTDKISWWDVPILRSRPYGLTLDRNDKVWFAGYHNSAIASFDPKTQRFRNYPVLPRQPSNIRRTNADSHNMMWVPIWGHVGQGRDGILGGGSLYRVDPATGKAVGYKMGIDYSNPYDADVDDRDNVWVATDNHIVMFDQKTSRFTRYPTPERTDIPKLSITRQGAIWFSPRNAGQSGGYGGAAAVLYPDKDNIRTLAAYYSDASERNHRMRYKGPTVKVSGVTRYSPAPMQNPGAYAAMLAKLGLKPTAAENGGQTRVLKSGAAVE